MALPTHNPKLPFTKPDWNGNPLSPKGLYTNLEGDDIKTLREVLKWQFGPKPLAAFKKGQQSPLNCTPLENIGDKSKNAIIPVGHASFIIDINGTRLWTDPVVAHNRFLKRYTPVPFDLNQMVHVDYLLLSHNHRDHIDKKSLKQICALNPKASILTGLETGKVLRRWGLPNPIQEAGWYQRYELPSHLVVDYLPTQHWSRRWFTDTNINLWGSYMIQDPIHHKTLYFGGDSGYAPHFKEIGRAYEIDLALIGVGAYEPKWFMASAHSGPEDALRAFADLGAKQWMPMHYGTFDLSDEPIFWPEKVLRGQHPQALDTMSWMRIGERMVF